MTSFLWIRDAGHLGWPQGLTLLLWLLTGALAWRSLLHAPVGMLQWDGQQWIWQTGSDSLGGAVQPALDLQRWVVLAFRPHAGPTQWFWLARAAEPAHWDALRRALWSRASRAAAGRSDALVDGQPDTGHGRA